MSMSRRTRICLCVALAMAAAWPFLVFYLGDQGALTARTRLQERSHFHREIERGTSLRQALDVVQRQYLLRITIDEQAFWEQGLFGVADTSVQLPKMAGIRAVTVLRLLLGQVNASYELRRGGQLVVVPGGQIDLKSVAEPIHDWNSFAKAIHRRDPTVVKRSILARPVNLDKGIDQNTPLADVLEFLMDRYDVTIACDLGAFGRQGISDVDTCPIRLPAQWAVPLSSVLQQVLDQVNGTFEVYEDIVLVVPKEP